MSLEDSLRTIVREELDDFAKQIAHHIKEPPLLLTGREAASMLRISEPTLKRLANEGRITPLKIGAHIKWPRIELQRFVDDHLSDVDMPPEAA